MTKVLVVGSGPAGLAAAEALRQLVAKARAMQEQGTG